MGNQPHIQIPQVQFIQCVEDQHFGEIQIYRSQDGKFIMKNMRTYIVDDKRHQQFITQLQCLQNVQSKCISQMNYCQRTKNTNLCIDYEVVQIYSEYFNFTLYDMVKANKQMQIAEIWLCLKQLVLLGQQLYQNGYTINIDINTIFITLKGLPLIYPIFLPVKNSVKLQKHPMISNIAHCIIKLATLQMFDNEKTLQKIQHLSKPLSNILEGMLNDDQLSYFKLIEQIQEYISNKEIKMVNEIKLNKFRYLIPASIDDVKSSQFSSRLSTYRPIGKVSSNHQNINKNGNNIIDKEVDDNKAIIFNQLQKKKLQNKILIQKLEERKNMIKGKNQTDKQNKTQSSLKSSKIIPPSFTRKVILSQCKVRDSYKNQ